jgi:hypothetical protein
VNAPKSKIEQWLDDARERVSALPLDHPNRWMLSRQLELIARGLKLQRVSEATPDGTLH